MIKTEISPEDLAEIEKICRARTESYQVVTRAKTLKLRYEGKTIECIAEALDVHKNTVLLTLSKFEKQGLSYALYDAPGRGRKTEITDEDKAWITHIACMKPCECGYAAELWTYKLLTEHIRRNAAQAGYPRLTTIAKSTVHIILNEHGIKPFKVKYYCEKRDEQFEEKMHEVLVVYKQVEMLFDEDGNLLPYDGQFTHTISYDEKPNIQAIGGAKDRAPIQGNGQWQRDCEYTRHGTLTLLAGIDLQTGIAIPHVHEKHNSSVFIEWLEKVDSMYPQGDKIRLILDNLSVHTSAQVKAYLATKNDRFEFVYTPKHGSWLNLIESFFSKMTKQMLRGIRVENKEELKSRIYKYFDEINKEPVVFRWTYKMKDFKLPSSEESPNT